MCLCFFAKNKMAIAKKIGCWPNLNFDSKFWTSSQNKIRMNQFLQHTFLRMRKNWCNDATYPFKPLQILSYSEKLVHLGLSVPLFFHKNKIATTQKFMMLTKLKFLFLNFYLQGKTNLAEPISLTQFFTHVEELTQWCYTFFLYLSKVRIGAKS
jgi:hypothetical protein